MRERTASGTPGPLSVTLIRTARSARASRLAISSRRGGGTSSSACWALAIRLVNTWVNWSASAASSGSAGSRSSTVAMSAVRSP